MLPLTLPNISSVQTALPDTTLPPRKLLRRIGSTDDYIMEMDWSSIDSYTTCERSSLWKLIYGRIGAPSYALTYGQAIHKALEEYYTVIRRLQGQGLPLGDQTIDAKLLCQRAAPIIVNNPPPPLEWRCYSTFENAIHKYVVKYRSDYDEFQVQHVEQAFAVDLCSIAVDARVPFPLSLLSDSTDDSPPFISRILVRWTGVIDLIVRDAALWIMDHKTSSVEGPSYWAGFELSGQFLGYCWAAQELTGEPISGAIANVIYGRKPTKTGNSLDFLRQRFFYTQEQISEWKSNMTIIMENLCHDLVTGHFPMKTRQCNQAFGICPYHDVCKLPQAQRQTMLQSNMYRNNVWTPLI